MMCMKVRYSISKGRQIGLEDLVRLFEFCYYYYCYCCTTSTTVRYLIFEPPQDARCTRHTTKQAHIEIEEGIIC